MNNAVYDFNIDTIINQNDKHINMFFKSQILIRKPINKNQLVLAQVIRNKTFDVENFINCFLIHAVVQ